MKILLFRQLFPRGDNFGKNEKGISLLIALFTMAVILSAALALSSMLLNQIKAVKEAGDSVLAFYAAESGLEKTLYFNSKAVSPGAKIGLCGICRECRLNRLNDPFGETASYCNNCQAAVLSADPKGCDPLRCDNCEITYDSDFDGKSYTVTATVSPDPSSPSNSYVVIKSRGFYRDTARESSYSLPLDF